MPDQGLVVAVKGIVAGFGQGFSPEFDQRGVRDL
jgi:hypothetical protein